MPKLSFNLFTTYPAQITGLNPPLFFRNATFFGVKSFNASGVPVSNSSTIYYGISSGECPMSVGAGSSSAYTINTSNERDSLSNYWVQGAIGDGCYIIYN